MRLVTAENLTHSNWTVNISEGGLPSPPRVAGDQPEIAAVGKTVHILWVANDPQLGAQTVLFYRRSRDNGKTWDARVRLFSDKELESAYNLASSGRWVRNHCAAQAATASSIPGSSNKWVAPGTTSSRADGGN